MSKTTATVLACVVCLIIITIYSALRVIYGLTGFIPAIIFIALITFAWKGIRGLYKQEDKDVSTTSRQGVPNRRRPILEVMQELSKWGEKNDKPLIYLICNQIITNDGLYPIRQLSPEEKRQLVGSENEMKEVETVLRKVYGNNNYILSESEYFTAIKQLKG
ncbi:MAG: hypothetical protein LBR10_15480 [Prevotellaceae bacterium]|jgi:hypothetical protein|nr:hypothetical protein [Prevotellaceae bacterium]